MRPTVNTPLSILNSEVKLLGDYYVNSRSVEIRYRRFIAELLFLRLFVLFEDAIAGVASRLACGAEYLNGKAPGLNKQSVSISTALNAFLTFNRARPLNYPKWTKAKFIVQTVTPVMDTKDPFIMRVQGHGALINEMRCVRNYIAHKNSNAKKEYQSVLRQAYGAQPNIPPGAYLVSEKRFMK